MGIPISSSRKLFLTPLEDDSLFLVHPPSLLVETLEGPVVLQLRRRSTVQRLARHLEFQDWTYCFVVMQIKIVL